MRRIWENQWITNRGELVLELETKLKQYLGVENIICMNNGTVPIQIALKNLANKGEVITTPFSYVATTSSIFWENCSPKFVDINPEYLTIDETKIENAISKNTTAILATHVFGNPCDVKSIGRIAKKYNLKVIYDAAHCFGVEYLGESIFNYGDVGTCSFHGTKLFHTGEGGALFCKNLSLSKKLFYAHNFGHKNSTEFFGLGINGKLSELQAAMGLAIFPYIENIIEKRKKIISYYNNNLDFSKLKTIKIRVNTNWNYSYYPIIFESEKILLNVQKSLNELNIFPRRYFYPSLNKLNYIQDVSMPISEDISSKVMCLPLYHNLSIIDLQQICEVILKTLKK